MQRPGRWAGQRRSVPPLRPLPLPGPRAAQVHLSASGNHSPPPSAPRTSPACPHSPPRVCDTDPGTPAWETSSPPPQGRVTPCAGPRTVRPRPRAAWPRSGAGRGRGRPPRAAPRRGTVRRAHAPRRPAGVARAAALCGRRTGSGSESVRGSRRGVPRARGGAARLPPSRGAAVPSGERAASQPAPRGSG